MALPAALAVLNGLLRGLIDLHEATEDGERLGLVHRDVNPSNILLSRHGDVKLTDLGVVRLTAAQETTVAGIHFIQEDSPTEIGQAIAGWVKGL